MKNKITITMLISFLFIAYGYSNDMFNVETKDISNTEEKYEAEATLSEDHVFTTMDIDGNIIEVDVEALEAEVLSEQAEILSAQQELMALTAVGGTSKAISYGVVNFQTKAFDTNTNYKNAETEATGYLNGYYGIDAAYLGMEGGQVKFKMGGVTGLVSPSDVQVIDISDTASAKHLSYYQVVNGKLYHYMTLDLNHDSSSGYYGVVQVGYQQSYMKAGVKYYSYDGHYFYESYQSMIDDYKAGTTTRSINNSNTYYNYYQFLSHRSETTFTDIQLDAYVKSKKPAGSIMVGLGDSFIENESKYGVNASLMYGVAANESAWGTSSIATNKNNLFGHAAYDSDPDGSSSSYSSPEYSIFYHANVFVSQGYLDPCDGKNTGGNGYNSGVCQLGRYKGSHLGDKASGMNVKYASDPYWGEKAAAVSWQLNNAYPDVKDYETYTIGIKTEPTNYNVRQEARDSSNMLYQTGNYETYPILILGKTSGQNVGGNDLWYKIQSDVTLNSSGDTMTQDKGVYDFDNYFGYIHSNGIQVVSNSDIIPPIVPSVKLGDVNGDDSIGAIDYLMIKDYIMGKISLNSTQKTAADVNKDNSIGAIDYLMIKDFIMGKLPSLD